MLEIDYGLIPLQPGEPERLQEEARVLARRGRVPSLSPSDYGRVVVVNPQEGFTMHHVPDDLRKPLRRAMQSVFSGSRPLPAETIAGEIDAGTETLYALVLELHSDFPSLHAFLARLPGLLQRHPACRLVLHADLTHTHDLLAHYLGDGTARFELYFDHMAEPLALDTPAALEHLLVHLPRYPTLNAPFFSELVLRAGGRAQRFTLQGLRRLYRLYGVGNIDELDVSGKLRERLTVVDLPLSAIRAVRFHAAVGERFQAVRIDGEKVPAARLQETGLLDEDVPLARIEAFYRKLPGREEEEIPLERVRALRVNCFEGHVSFLWKPSPRYVPLYELRRLAMYRGENGGPGERIAFDATVVTEPHRPRFGDVRAALRRGYLERVYRANLERQAKLRHFAEDLKIACLGPLAAQTLRLLKPHGLAKALPTGNLYYLCDSIEDLPHYHKSHERLRDHYRHILGELRRLFTEPQRTAAVEAEVVSHRLPVVMEWARGDPTPFAKLRAEELDTMYKELQVFIRFCEAEFRRVDRERVGTTRFLEQLGDYQRLALRVRQVASLIGGRFGRFFSRETFPDFVFFGNETDTERNGEAYFLPGLAWSQFFADPAVKELFSHADFEFSVFLEEQIGLMNHLRRQEPDEPTLEAFADRYFGERIREAEAELTGLQHLAHVEPRRRTPQYEAAVQRLTRHHREEIDAFAQDSEEEARRLGAQEERYFEALRQVVNYLGEDGPAPESLLDGGDYIRALDTQLVERSADVLKALRASVHRNTQAVNRLLDDKRKQLRAFLQAFRNMQKARIAVLHAEHVDALRRDYAAAVPDVLERLNDLRRVTPEEAARMEETVRKRRAAAGEEQARVEARINDIMNGAQQRMADIRDGVRRINARLSQPLQFRDPELSPAEMLGALEERLNEAEAGVARIVRSAADSRDDLSQFQRQYRRLRETAMQLYISGNELALLQQAREQSRFQRAVARRFTEPLVAPPKLPEAADPETARTEHGLYEAEWQGKERRLVAFGAKEQPLRETREQMQRYNAFQEVYALFRRTVRNKLIGQRALNVIARRLQLLREEAERLPELMEAEIMPAYQELCRRVYIPNTEKRIAHYRQARTFLNELSRLSFEELQRQFLDRGIFRRFHAAQFLNGAFYGMNPDSSLFPKLTNVSQALYLFHRGIRRALGRMRYPEERVTLTKLQTARPTAITEFCESQRRLPPEQRLTYLMLPGTLSLPQALDIIRYKDAAFNGLPQLVLIYVSRFDVRHIHDDEALRQRYFAAMRHNVVLNVDDERVVDNPGAIAAALIRETVGCAHDVEQTELLQEVNAELRAGTL